MKVHTEIRWVVRNSAGIHSTMRDRETPSSPRFSIIGSVVRVGAECEQESGKLVSLIGETKTSRRMMLGSFYAWHMADRLTGVLFPDGEIPCTFMSSGRNARSRLLNELGLSFARIPGSPIFFIDMRGMARVAMGWIQSYPRSVDLYQEMRSITHEIIANLLSEAIQVHTGIKPHEKKRRIKRPMPPKSHAQDRKHEWMTP